MDDRELLELAAKAEGCEWAGQWDSRWGCLTNYEGWTFDPLRDDGDALRLAVKLEIDLEVDYFTKTVTVGWYDKRGNPAGLLDTLSIFFDNADPYAATRRAIVRAAAEIGKTL